MLSFTHANIKSAFMRSAILWCCLTIIASIMTATTAQANPAELSEIPKNLADVIHLPTGFKLNVFAKLKAGRSDYFSGPRMMTFDEQGNLLVSTGLQNQVWLLPDANHDGIADSNVLISDRLNGPQGLAFVGGKLLVANQDGVVQLEQSNGKVIIKSFISNLPSGGHTLKNIKLGPDGYLYINVGSSCNVCAETNPLRATLLRYTAEGKAAGALVTLGHHAPSSIYAYGLRNAQGFAWQPETDAMYATNNGADMRADRQNGKANDAIPPEHLNIIEAGKHYGWPHCWGNQVTDQNFIGTEGFCKNTQPPTIMFDSHSTPIGITFLKQANFPAEYKNDAIVALHGSWNRDEPSGYKLVRVKFKNNQAIAIEDFATGWLKNKEAWGRPVDVVIGPDGALFISDDRAGLIYRITYPKLVTQE